MDDLTPLGVKGKTLEDTIITKDTPKAGYHIVVAKFFHHEARRKLKISMRDNILIVIDT